MGKFMRKEFVSSPACLGVYNGEDVAILGGRLHLLLSDLAVLLLGLSFTERRKSKQIRLDHVLLLSLESARTPSANKRTSVKKGYSFSRPQPGCH
jgi:hypothetical protein